MTGKMPYGLRFAIIGRMFKQQLDAQLSEKELTGVQLTVLKNLGRLENAGVQEVNQRDLENASHVTHPTMTEILKRLERKGFISCCQSSIDRRSKSISSTDKAQELHQEVDELDEVIFRQLCQGLTEEQRASILAMTDVMLENAFRSCKKGSEEDD